MKYFHILTYCEYGLDNATREVIIMTDRFIQTYEDTYTDPGNDTGFKKEKSIDHEEGMSDRFGDPARRPVCRMRIRKRREKRFFNCAVFR